MKHKVKVKFAPDKSHAILWIKGDKDCMYEVTVGTYEGKGLRIWIDDYNPANEIQVAIDEEWGGEETLMNPLNKKTKKGAIVEKAIEIYDQLKVRDYKFSYF